MKTDGTFNFGGVPYPIIRSQPLAPHFSWDNPPHTAELTIVKLGDFGSGVYPSSIRLRSNFRSQLTVLLPAALFTDTPRDTRDISALAFRAPESVVRTQSGKEIDIWAIGCMV